MIFYKTQKFNSMKALWILFVLLITGFTSFSQEENDKPTPLLQKIEAEVQQIRDKTNWSNQEEANKALVRIQKLMDEVDKANGKSANSNNGFPADTIIQSKTTIGSEMAEIITNEIISDFANDEGANEISNEFYQETSLLMIDLGNPKPGLSLADVNKFSNLQVLFINGTKSGAEINLDSLFIQLEDKPITELYLVRNYSGTKLIPESIGKLSKLNKLGLYSNEIASLPISIQNLTELEELYVDLNPVEKLPAEIVKLKKLKMLGIAKTGIGAEEQARIQKLVPNCKILTK